MPVCNVCGQDMADADGCTDDRTITFPNGEELDPVPWGEDDFYETFSERVSRLEQEIADGGRGRLTPDDLREELDEFVRAAFPEEFNNRTCHDCGAEVGEYHHPGCDAEECPKCGGQFLTCGCHDGADF